MKKKALSIALILSVISSMIILGAPASLAAYVRCFSASADYGASAKAGEVVDVTFSSLKTDCAAFSFDVDYDSRLTAVGVADLSEDTVGDGGIFVAPSLSATGLACSYAAATNAMIDGDLFSVSFKVPDDAAVGTSYTVKVKNQVAYKADSTVVETMQLECNILVYENDEGLDLRRVDSDDTDVDYGEGEVALATSQECPISLIPDAPFDADIKGTVEGIELGLAYMLYDPNARITVRMYSDDDSYTEVSALMNTIQDGVLYLPYSSATKSGEDDLDMSKITKITFITTTNMGDEGEYVLLKSFNVRRAFIFGDVNMSKTVDIIDSIYLARYLATWTGYEAGVNVDVSAADVKAGGGITTTDAVVLSRHLADWSGYETLPIE